MTAYLIAEEGPLSGLTIRLEEGDEWILGRDPETSFQVLEDPMVSRQHVVCRLTDEGYIIENLSAVNPAQLNGKAIDEPMLLTEGDLLQIGNSLFRFTAEEPSEKEKAEEKEEEIETPTIFEEEEGLESLSFTGSVETRWMIKVISGPNAGAEFGIEEGQSYIIGKEASSCDIVFQDLSVSREHAKITLQEDGRISIEDLRSRNGTLVNGYIISGEQPLKSQDLIAIGTTSFLIIDRQETGETIVSPPSMISLMEEKRAAIEAEEAAKRAPKEPEVVKKSWKKMVIPTRHLVIASAFAFLIILALAGTLSLFKTTAVEIAKVNYDDAIRDKIKNFPDVTFNYTHSSGKLFLLGHVLTEVDHQELTYLLKTLPFIDKIEDNVIIDELVSESFNGLLVKNSKWRGVTTLAPAPGRFVIRGYVDTSQEAGLLEDYIHLNFPYLDRLKNEVVIANNLNAAIAAILMNEGFVNVTYQLTNGDLVLAGRVNEKQQNELNEVLSSIKNLNGIREIKNFIVITTEKTGYINISDKFKVTGTSKLGGVDQYVVVDGKILGKGDVLDGMTVTQIKSDEILLEKDGLKYKITYNQ